MQLKKITSFKIDHTVREPGFYLNGIANGVSTFDLRFKKPNGGNYLDYKAIHTIEHLFATVIRNSPIKDNVVYFGPMGCRTGFYLLLLNADLEQALPFVASAIALCLTLDEIPGAAEAECGNYKEHDLSAAKAELAEYIKVLTKLC